MHEWMDNNWYQFFSIRFVSKCLLAFYLLVLVSVKHSLRCKLLKHVCTAGCSRRLKLILVDSLVYICVILVWMAISFTFSMPVLFEIIIKIVLSVMYIGRLIIQLETCSTLVLILVHKNIFSCLIVLSIHWQYIPLKLDLCSFASIHHNIFLLKLLKKF